MKTVYVKRVEQPEIRKLDLSLFKKKGNSKTYKGYMIQKMKQARNNNNPELAAVIQHFYKKYLEFETQEALILKGWKGKSSFQIIKKPDKFIVITFQKENQDTEPKQIKREISKKEVNEVIRAIEHFKDLEKISTRDIGEYVYKGMTWDEIFAHRFKHTQLNLILRLLDYYGLTRYRGKYTKILNLEEIK